MFGLRLPQSGTNTTGPQQPGCEALMMIAWLFCRITELGLLRLLTNVHVMGAEVWAPLAAWEVYDVIRSDSRILFLSQQIGFSEQWSMVRGQLSGGTNTVTDAYLAVFAKHANATVVTFDRGFKAVGGCEVLVIS